MRIALTGGTGSLGTALIERLARGGADRIVTVTRDEHRRAALQAKYEWHPGVKVYAGDVRDTDRMRDVFAGCEVVIHAAARKVVSGHYDEPREMLLTNIQGTANVLAAARYANVGRVLFISSDKAVAPINVYGMSKAYAERLVISENARSFAGGTRCSVVRYGNVLASNGSVVKIWREKAERGEPLTVTDDRMTRFWWTIGDAADAALRAVAQMKGGEVLVPKLKAAPLTRLLEAVMSEGWTLPGLIPNTGIRPGGEKLHESLLDEEELRRALERNDWYVVPPLDNSDLWDRTPWLGEPVPEGFTYDSNTWPEQWSVDELRELLVEPGRDHSSLAKDMGAA